MWSNGSAYIERYVLGHYNADRTLFTVILPAQAGSDKTRR